MDHDISDEKSGDNSLDKTCRVSPMICPSLSSLSEPLNVLNNINSLKNSLCELHLNPCEQKYIATNITPLLSVLDQLGRISSQLSASVSVLSNSTVVCPKRQEIEQSIHLIYNINNKCEELYCDIEKRINDLIKVIA